MNPTATGKSTVAGTAAARGNATTSANRTAASMNDEEVFTTACAGLSRRNSSPHAKYSTPNPEPAAVEKMEHHGCVK